MLFYIGSEIDTTKIILKVATDICTLYYVEV